MERVTEFIKRNKINIIIAVIYMIITMVTMFHHEIWRDEAQAWCIVRDCNISEIINRARIEGHPLLWYMLLLPFAKLGVDVFSMQIISLLLVLSAVLYLLFKSPFNTITKILITFSAGMLYFLPIVARNYALIPILIFMLADIYPKRHEKPYIYALLIILLSNTHSLIWGFCLIIYALFGIESIQNSIREKKIKNLIPLILIGINFAYLFFMFYGITSQNKAVIHYSELFKERNTLLEALLTYPSAYLEIPNTAEAVIFYISLIVFSVGALMINRKILLILLASFTYSFYIYYYVWFNGIVYQKLFVLFLVLIFAFWVIRQKSTAITAISFYIIFVLSGIYSVQSVTDEIKYNFSASKETAEYIKKNLPDEKILYIEGYPFVYSPISAYLPNVKLYYFRFNKYITYHDFLLSDNNQEKEIPELRYLIADYFLPELDDPFEKIFQSQKRIISGTSEREEFRIYKMNDL